MSTTKFDRIPDLWARATRRIPGFAAATPMGGYGPDIRHAPGLQPNPGPL